jgi:hypothetical protein
MKKLLLTITILGILAFTVEKKLTVSLTEKQATRMFNDLNNIQIMIDRSSMPHDQAKYIVGSIDSIKADILPQLQKQLNDSLPKK